MPRVGPQSFSCVANHPLAIMSTDCNLVYGRPVSRMQIRQILESKTTAARQLLLPQDVRYTFIYPVLSSLRLPLNAIRCESCIDRLYTLGPAPCPICGKTLKKMTFIPQTFEDLVVEKEVAVRRKLAKELVAGQSFTA